MDISYLGANCVFIANKHAKIIVDPLVPGLKTDYKHADIVMLTHQQEKPSLKESQLLIDSAGEYEARGVSIYGIPARAHMDEEGKSNAIIYRMDINNLRIGIIGHIYPELSDELLEKLGAVDILIIPIGGHGYTLDAEGARQVIKNIEPSIVIPTHYADPAIKYEVPQDKLDSFIEELGAPFIEESKFKIKDDSLPEQLTVYKLNRTI